jgi:hypothetical protein
MEVVIAVLLLGVGATVLVGGYRLLRNLMARAAELGEAEPELDPASIEVTGEVGPDGLVYLFAHDFVREKHAPAGTPNRDRAYAPLTDAELDAEDWAVQILYAALCELHSRACVQFRVVDRAPTLMPPFPHKRWELEMIQRTPFPSSPIVDALDVAIDIIRQRKQQRVAQGKEEPGELWCPLDEVIERGIKAMRQEIGFWERAGIYGDLRNYVASALVAQGYLIQPGRETWLDRFRSKRLKPNTPAVNDAEGVRDALRRRLEQFRCEHGSPYARGEAEEEPVPGQRQPVKDVDPVLCSGPDSLDCEMPLDDCLRISLYEALVSLKQLEPSGDAGV